MPALPRLAALAAGTLLLLCGAACTSPGEGPPGHPPGGRPHGPPHQAFRPMEAGGMFFAGGIEALLVLDRMVEPRLQEAPERDHSPDDARGNSLRMRTDQEVYNPEYREPPPKQEGPPPMDAGRNPPLQFTLRLSNHGNAAVEVEVARFRTELGEFVVSPRRLLLPPGKTAALDPMVTRAGIPSGAMPATLVLRLGGTAEEQVLVLKPAAIEPAPPPPPPPPQ